MPNNITLASGQVVRTNDISGIHWPWQKLAVGVDGVADPVAVPVDALAAGALPALGMHFNGSNYDRTRGNIEYQLLASAARTVATASATQTNHNWRGVVMRLSVTAAGTGTLTVILQTTGGFSLCSFAAGTGSTLFFAYPGLVNAATTQNIALPRTWNAYVNKSDASSWTYNLEAHLVV